jgi:hypothetical protein
MPSQEEIDNQQSLLLAYRRTLMHLLQQAAQFGGIVFAPPQVANSIHEARGAIQQIKRTLHDWGGDVADLADVRAQPRRRPMNICGRSPAWSMPGRIVRVQPIRQPIERLGMPASCVVGSRALAPVCAPRAVAVRSGGSGGRLRSAYYRAHRVAVGVTVRRRRRHSCPGR